MREEVCVVWVRVSGRLLEAGGLLWWIGAHLEYLFQPNWNWPSILTMIFFGFAFFILGAYLEFMEE